MAQCPCEIVEACREECSCANPSMSGGCDRCCTYGSPGQQWYAAKTIAMRLARKPR